MRNSIIALMGLATLLLSLVLIFLVPGSRIIWYGLLAIGAAFIAIATALDIKRVGGAIRSGRGRFNVGTSLSIVLFLAIVLLVNAISVGQSKRMDFTGLNQFTLTSQTKKVLSDLTTQVEIVSFFSPSVAPEVRNYSRDLLAEYAVYADSLTIREVGGVLAFRAPLGVYLVLATTPATRRDHVLRQERPRLLRLVRL